VEYFDMVACTSDTCLTILWLFGHELGIHMHSLATTFLTQSQPTSMTQPQPTSMTQSQPISDPVSANFYDPVSDLKQSLPQPNSPVSTLLRANFAYCIHTWCGKSSMSSIMASGRPGRGEVSIS